MCCSSCRVQEAPSCLSSYLSAYPAAAQQMSAAAVLFVHTQLMHPIHVGSHVHAMHVGSHGCCCSFVPAVTHFIHCVESDHHVMLPKLTVSCCLLGTEWPCVHVLVCHARPHQMIVGGAGNGQGGLAAPAAVILGAAAAAYAAATGAVRCCVCFCMVTCSTVSATCNSVDAQGRWCWCRAWGCLQRIDEYHVPLPVSCWLGSWARCCNQFQGWVGTMESTPYAVVEAAVLCVLYKVELPTDPSAGGWKWLEHAMMILEVLPAAVHTPNDLVAMHGII